MIERNKHHSRAYFCNLKREPGKKAAEIRKRILETEKNRKFEKTDLHKMDTKR